MIEFYKLKALHEKQRIKKIIKILEQLEKMLVAKNDSELLDNFYLKQLYDCFSSKLNLELNLFAEKLFSKVDSTQKEKLIFINKARHQLYTFTGVEPSEWDLILPELFQNQNIEHIKRSFFKKIFVYTESLRSPFNLGNIFRTSDAFGVQKIFISPDCVPPTCERAKRSAMGAIGYVPHERKALPEILASLPKNFPVIALETGGENMNDFSFPNEGLVIIGSEELGISPESLSLCQSRVSIKMYGIKASLNVGVAFGIFMQKWASVLDKD